MDDLDELLSPRALPPEPPAVRSALERDVTRLLRRRRWFVRGRRAVVLAACYAAGLASMWFWSQAHRPAPPEVVQRGPNPPPAPAPSPAPSPGDDDPYRGDPPERLERWAYLATGAKQVALYRRAGDLFLEQNDLQSALRCYRRALDGGTTADLAIQADKDSWLLMSMKMARQKERVDARN